MLKFSVYLVLFSTHTGKQFVWVSRKCVFMPVTRSLSRPFSFRRKMRFVIIIFIEQIIHSSSSFCSIVLKRDSVCYLCLDIDVHHFIVKKTSQSHATQRCQTLICLLFFFEQQERRGKSYRIDASLFVLTIVYIEREGSFFFFPLLFLYCVSICLRILYITEDRDINHRLAHVRRQMTHVRDIQKRHNDCLSTTSKKKDMKNKNE